MLSSLCEKGYYNFKRNKQLIVEKKKNEQECMKILNYERRVDQELKDETARERMLELAENGYLNYELNKSKLYDVEGKVIDYESLDFELS